MAVLSVAMAVLAEAGAFQLPDLLGRGAAKSKDGKAFEATSSEQGEIKDVSAKEVFMSQFVRENRYLVLKATDLQAVGLTVGEFDALKAVVGKVDQYRRDAGKPDLECVVVEQDWPEYEPTWQAIERRVTSRKTQ